MVCIPLDSGKDWYQSLTYKPLFEFRMVSWNNSCYWVIIYLKLADWALQHEATHILNLRICILHWSGA